jgi:hypothetical protein
MENASSQVYIDPATVTESAASGASINESSDGVATESLVQGSVNDQSTESKQPEHPKSLPPWLDIIVYWQHTKADQPISPTWNIKSSITYSSLYYNAYS